MDWLVELIKNLPQILLALAKNREGLVAFVWLVASITMVFMFKDAPPWMRALLFVFALGGIFYLATLILKTNKEVQHAEISGYVYYEVDKNGNLTPEDGRIYSLNPNHRQYGQLQVGDQLQTAEASKLYRNPHVEASEQFAMTKERECLTIIEAGHPVEVVKASSGGWFRVRPIPCPS
jgi:hypothetical protein